MNPPANNINIHKTKNMIKNKGLLVLLAGIIFSTTICGQTNQRMTDYLHVPGPVVFDGRSFNLSWSSHPEPGFYKQEYIPKGDNAGRFNSMILIDVIESNSDIKDIVAAKISDLKKLKLSSPLVNYESFDNPQTGEYIIDFLLSANAADGSTSVVERNVYRYKTISDKTGKKAIMLFGISTRSYGDDIDVFFASLKSTKKELVNEVAKYVLPEVNVK
jgi:hypothetical protein